MISLGSDVRIGAPGGIIKAVELTIETGNICWHDRILVGRPSKVVAETSPSGKVDSIIMCYDFRRYISRSPNNCYIRLRKIISKDTINQPFQLDNLHRWQETMAGKTGCFPHH